MHISNLVQATVMFIHITNILFVDAFSTHIRGPTREHFFRQQSTLLHLSNIIDAEFIPDDNTGGTHANELSLIEYSQNQDPEWKNMPVAFCDTNSNTYIDCNLAFYVKDPLGDDNEGAEYALGTPCEVPIVVALELGGENTATTSTGEGEDGTTSVINLSKVVPINPDDNTNEEGDSSIMKDEEKEEIFQMAARALMDEFGQSIRLKKTPRVLSIEGDLDSVIGDWKEVLLGSVNGGGKDKKLSVEEVVNMYEEEEDEEDIFDTIMRRDLGDNYMDLVDDDDDEIDEELLNLFASEGLDGDLNELVEGINAKGGIKDSSYDQLIQQLQPSAALKLLDFVGPGGKEYTILRPLRPILLVGREDPDDYTRRILLTEDERSKILPRLENACRDGLEKAGFFLAGSGSPEPGEESYQ